MTSPYGDKNDPNKFEQDNGGGLPRYESTPHPEDQPQFGAPNPTSGYGRDNVDPYGQYNAGYQDNAAAYGHGPGYQGYDAGYGSVGGQTREGDGHVDIIDAIKWGFKATFKNAKLWILGSLAFIALAFILGLILGLIGLEESSSLTLVSPTDILSALVASLLTPFIYRLCLHQIDDSSTGWGHIGKDVNFVPTYLVVVLIQLVSWVIMWFVLNGLFKVDLSVIQRPGVSDAEIADAVLNLVLGLGVVVLFTMLVTPFLLFIPWYVSERRATFGESFGQGISAGARNFFPLIGYMILYALMAVVLGILTFGLGLIILMPASMLSMAYLYRQAARGQVPVNN